MGRIFRLSLRGCESEVHHRSGLRPSPTARFARGEGSACGMLAGALVSLRSGDALTAFGGGLRFAGFQCLEIVDGRPCYAPSPCFLFLGWRESDARDFVAGSSSPAAPSRSSRTAARTARRWWLGILPPAPFPGECPEGRTGRHTVPSIEQPLSGAGKRMLKEYVYLLIDGKGCSARNRIWRYYT